MIVQQKIMSLCFVFLLINCANNPPRQPNNLCAVFKEHPDWYKASKNAEKKWNVPIHVPLAIMYQESSFKHDAKPPMQYFLGFIPKGRASSSYGYSQAKDGTWDQYKKSTHQRFASRSNFADSVDFISWYVVQTKKINGISTWDAYHQYLNYHEGWYGYQKKSYLKKAWLNGVAHKVDKRAKQYAIQYIDCRQELEKKRKRFWLF